MSRFHKKDWVCLVTPDELDDERRMQAETNGGPPRVLQAPLWRQIEITATAEIITIGLGSVDEETSLGGVSIGGHSARSVTLSWEDLGNFDCIARAFRHEQVGVLQRAGEMLQSLHLHGVSLRQALTA